MTYLYETDPETRLRQRIVELVLEWRAACAGYEKANEEWLKERNAGNPDEDDYWQHAKKLERVRDGLSTQLELAADELAETLSNSGGDAGASAEG